MFNAKRFSDMVILLSLGVIANIFSFDIAAGYFGKFSIVYTLAYISGIFLGPYAGMMITWLADLIPGLALPQGPYMPFIGLGTAMMSLIVGLCNRHLPFKFHTRLIIGAVISYFVCTCGITAAGSVPIFDMGFGFAKLLGKTFNIQSRFLMISLSKLISQPVWILINLAITITLCYRLSRFIDNRYGGVINRERDKEKIKLKAEAEPYIN